MSKRTRLNRRQFCGVAAAAVAAGMTRKIEAMASVAPDADSDFAELRARIRATRWPDDEESSALRELAVYWADGYDWSGCKERLNRLASAGFDAVPRRIRYAMSDSPVGLAGWALDHDDRMREYSRDEVLDHVTLCWLTL